MINMLRAQKRKVDSMQEQMGTVCQEMETLRHIQSVRNQNINKIMNTFDMLIIGLDKSKERINEFEYESIETI